MEWMASRDQMRILYAGTGNQAGELTVACPTSTTTQRVDNRPIKIGYVAPHHIQYITQ